MSIVKEVYPNRHPLLGRNVVHDSRSLNFTYPTEGLYVQSVVHERHIPILDQGGVGSCTADAGIGNLATSPIFEPLPGVLKYVLNQVGVLALYNDEEVLDWGSGYPPTDNGSSGLTCAKMLKAAGLISAYQWVFSADAALRALSVTPFMFGTDWTGNMFDPDPDGRVHPEGKIEGGHEILCREYDQPNNRLWFDNSWGTSWGVGGRFYLTFEDFSSLLAHNGDVVILLPLPWPSQPQPTHRRHHRHHREHRRQ